MNAGKSFDYVIVGAGSAGCVLTNRLTEDPNVSVLVIEAGGPDSDPWIHIPLGWGKILNERRHDWMYFTEPEPHCDNRKIECARGKVLGGSSSINAMAYVRGHRGDYDRWRQKGCTGWSYADMLPYLKRSENWLLGGDDYRGDSGPLNSRETTFEDPLVQAYLKAGESAGYGITKDYNAEQNEGFGLIQQTIRDGRRCSAAVAYLRPAMQRPNVSVETKAMVNRLIWENNRIVGVEYSQNGKTVEVRANREVILSGGVINTPQLMMLSGIGRAEDLAAHGIEAKVNLPGVGQNLQDHLSVMAEYHRPDPGPFRKNMRFDRAAMMVLQAYFFGTGPGTDLPSGFMAFMKTRPELDIPDIQFLVRATTGEAGLWFPGIKKAFEDGFGCRAVLLHPESRGEIKLASADPREPMKIYQNFLSAENDLRTIRDGLKIVRDVAAQSDLDSFRGEENFPGKNVQTDDELDAFIRATALTAHHPLGTCKMGSDDDEMAVVNPECQVRGVDGLRVIDGSIIPDMVGGNINAPIIAMAERMSDILRGKQPLARVEM
jgi:4-pyridoxate dehydrogenase